MPRRKREKYPILVSERDRKIYHEIAVVQRTQRDVAAQFKVSQPRVGKIVERVFQWMSETAPCGFAEVPRPQRLYAVARTYKQKLEWYEQEAKEAWRQSKKETPWTSTHDVIEGDGEKKKLSPGKVTQKAPKPDVKYLNAGQKFAATLVEFEGFAKDGSVARNNDDRLHEVPQVLPEEELDVLIRNGKVAEKMKRERELAAAAAASAAVAPSPLYSGERVGVRGAAQNDSNPSMDTSRSGYEDYSIVESVPAPAPHPSPLPGVPGRGDRTLGPSAAVLSNDSAETHLDRENMGPNDFHEGLSNAEVEHQTAVASATETPSPQCSDVGWVEDTPETHHTRRRIGGPRGVPLDPPYEVDGDIESVPAPAPYPSPLPGVPRRGDNTSSDYIVNSDGLVVPRPKPQKVYPPTPDGYWRFGDVCRPKMTRRAAIDWTKVRPMQRVKPPRYYQLSEDGKEWWPRS